MPITITRRYHFEAAHWLPLVAETHKCHRLHGHNYEIEVTVSKPLQDDGFLIDFWELDKIVQPIIDTIDHRCLNDIQGLSNPTAELIGMWFIDKLASHGIVSAMRVYETKDCWADVISGHDQSTPKRVIEDPKQHWRYD
jgi:6-pyruvoyltetrahydropterin/6-carboxytetrahydropterin synthase